MIITVLGWIVFGLVAGAIGRWLMPGPQPMGYLATSLLGITGSFVGGFLGYLFFGGEMLQGSGWIGSIIGTLVVLAVAASWGHGREAEAH